LARARLAWNPDDHGVRGASLDMFSSSSPLSCHKVVVARVECNETRGDQCARTIPGFPRIKSGVATGLRNRFGDRLSKLRRRRLAAEVGRSRAVSERALDAA